MYYIEAPLNTRNNIKTALSILSSVNGNRHYPINDLFINSPFLRKAYFSYNLLLVRRRIRYIIDNNVYCYVDKNDIKIKYFKE